MTVSLLAVSAQTQDLWAIALVAGAVVLVVVVVLLSWLLKVVVQIDEGVGEVWQSAKRVAGNTATTWQLRDTAEALRALEQEARRHDQLLEESS